jgi:hypothetical protein
MMGRKLAKDVNIRNVPSADCVHEHSIQEIIYSAAAALGSQQSGLEHVLCACL